MRQILRCPKSHQKQKGASLKPAPQLTNSIIPNYPTNLGHASQLYIPHRISRLHKKRNFPPLDKISPKPGFRGFRVDGCPTLTAVFAVRACPERSRRGGDFEFDVGWRSGFSPAITSQRK